MTELPYLRTQRGYSSVGNPTAAGRSYSGHTELSRPEGYADYFERYVDRLEPHEQAAVWRGELDIAARPDWRPPV